MAQRVLLNCSCTREVAKHERSVRVGYADIIIFLSSVGAQ